ncbi:alpha-hydroxy acid oxidase [Hydrogenophaga sp.]|uniref:alpha-hydroxy acid oxidase n=1 Tax=Hydrogenophaga sp. TaxID=1904254 RepID=UPI00271BE322|nr:alpha-hydroxy acid oxidase [Hydrogenophaga sp.]MDO9434502.1 alpha-hydroxy acid oxidase [Hydrogenophaga sp.]
MTARPDLSQANRTLPAGVATLADHEQHALGQLDEATRAYLSGAAADELTYARNLDAWRRIELLPRVLRPLAGGHTQIELLGRTLAHPILVAPMAYQRLAHPDGEHATALAAAALGAGLVFSTQASAPLDDIAKVFLPEPGRGPLWFQLYLQPDRGFTQELVQRAESAGFEALVLTVDAPVQGTRDRERRTQFRLPADISAVNLTGMRTPPARSLAAGQSALFDDLLTHAPTWDDVTWLRSVTRLPVMLKGILHPDDARQAIDVGVAGVIVSNHGGRTLDTAVSTAAALPRIAQAVQGQIPVLVDGGIRRGTDVLKAIGLGASAVLVGRPVLHGLTNAGATGVAHVLRLLRDELEIAMALTGCRTLTDASSALALQEPQRSG